MKLLPVLLLLVLPGCWTMDNLATPPELEAEVTDEAYRFMVHTGRQEFADHARILVRRRPVPTVEPGEEPPYRREIWTVSFLEDDPFHRLVIEACVCVERRSEEGRIQWLVSHANRAG